MFGSILTSTSGLTFEEAAVCTVVSVILGLCVAAVYILQGEHSKNFVITLALLPSLVQVVIMMVNGNLGTGIAVMGAFSLVRFRSVPGSSKEIVCIFFAMAVGLATGMGYVTFAAAVTVVVGGLLLLFCRTSFGEMRNNDRDLRVTIPENLDYTDMFQDIFEKYTAGEAALHKVRTTNMGSLYELTYRIRLKDSKLEKKMIDDIRCRNGNLTVVCSRASTAREEL